MRRILLFLLLASFAFGQGSFIPPQTAFRVVNGLTSPIANATITVCAGNASGLPCAPVTVLIYKDLALTQPLSNPFTTDAAGNYQFVVGPGTYTVTVTAFGFFGYSYQISVSTTGAGGIVGSPTKGAQVASDPTGTFFAPQAKPIYDTRDWMTCDGSTDTSAGLHTLLATIGTQEATIHFIGTTTPSASCRIGNTLFPANVTLDFSGGGSIQLISSTTLPGGAAFVNGTSVECGAGTTCAAPALSTTVGNTLVVMDAPYPGFTFKITSITDNCGDFFLHVFQSLAGQTRNQGMWVASSIAGGSCTVTATANGSLTTNMMMVQQYSGLGPVASIDGLGASSNTVQNPMSSGPATTTAGSLLVGFGGQPFQAETCTAGAGFIQAAGVSGQTTNGFMCAEYQLSSAGGSVTATQNITVLPANLVYSLVPLKPGNATATIWGGIVNPDNHKIFYNADGATGHGVVDFTGTNVLAPVLPEWWGASGTASAPVNTPALQAAIWGAYGCGPNTCRPNGSGLNQYNLPLLLSAVYLINDELKFYHVVGNAAARAQLICHNGGITQTAVNKRIIASDPIAYFEFDGGCVFTAGASTTTPLVHLNYTGTQGADIPVQFVDFHESSFVGNSQADVGVLIGGSGAAQGSNIYCHDCAFQNFTGAAWQVGGDNTGRNAGRVFEQNALSIGLYGGDIQGSPLYGIADYGGGYIFAYSTTFENGFTAQTGYDFFCTATQGPCIEEHVRSESRKTMSSDNLVMLDSRNINQAAFPAPGNTFPVFPAVASIVTGNRVTGDGAYYKVTANASAFSGYGSPTAPVLASSGTATTLVDTNETVAGSVTILTPTLGELMTQATTGATGTLLRVPASNGTITGVATGQFVFGETITQAVTGVTATEQSPSPAPGGTSLVANNFSGTADNSHTWTGGTSGATFAPSTAPVFSVSNPPMLISAHTGGPDNSHDWVGGTSGAHYTPTAVPATTAWTVNAFNGMLVGIWTGTNINCYGVITANSANSITVAAGWVTKYPLTSCSAPDSTSTFIVEPNWNQGTVTDGGMTLVYMNEDVIHAASTARIEDVIAPGGQVYIWGNGSARNTVQNLLTSRGDWYNNTGGNNPQTCCSVDRDWDVRPILPGGSAPIVWSYPIITATAFSGSLQKNLGTKVLVWDIASAGATAANDVWIGGRSDPGAGMTATRNILEVGGMLGRAARLGTDLAGTDTDLTGGPSTGAGNGGAINFYTSNPSGSSAIPNSGLKRWRISAAGNLGATQGKGQHIETQAANNDIGGSGASPLTVTFTTAYTSTPICVVMDVSAAPAVVAMSAYSNTGFTATGTAGHTLNYICLANPN